MGGDRAEERDQFEAEGEGFPLHAAFSSPPSLCDGNTRVIDVNKGNMAPDQLVLDDVGPGGREGEREENQCRCATRPPVLCRFLTLRSAAVETLNLL